MSIGTVISSTEYDDILLASRLWKDLKKNLRQANLPSEYPLGVAKMLRETLDFLRTLENNCTDTLTRQRISTFRANINSYFEEPRNEESS